MVRECRHGKPYHTEDDMRAYESRSYCVDQGDCTCHLCSQVCWICPVPPHTKDGDRQ